LARARNIKPGFFKNEDLAECSAWARLCFAGLWTLADREGRLEDRPKRIKGELFAFDTVDVEPLLVELAQFGFILRYEAQDRRFIQIISFQKHQNPHHKEPPSTIPSPESPGFLPHASNTETEALPSFKDGETLGKSEATPSLFGNESAKHGVETVLNPDSGFLNPDSGFPIPQTPKGPDAFDEFWKAYPNKTGKDAARKAFDKRKPGKQLLGEMLQAITAQKQTEQWTKQGGQFIPNPATWLNQGRWQDGEPVADQQPEKDWV
jgi:hypothetical protein